MRLILKKTTVCLEVMIRGRNHNEIKQVVDKERARLAETLDTVVSRVRLIVAPSPNPHDKQTSVTKFRWNKKKQTLWVGNGNHGVVDSVNEGHWTLHVPNLQWITQRESTISTVAY